MSTEQEFKAFVQEKFVIDELDLEGTTERAFVDAYCDHFHYDDTRRMRLKASHETMMIHLVRLCPAVRRSKVPKSNGKTQMLTNVHARDWRYREDGTRKAEGEDLDRFIAERCILGGKCHAPQKALASSYNSFAKNARPASVVYLTRLLMKKIPTLRRSIRRVPNGGRYTSTRCLEGIGLIEAAN